MRGSEIHNLVLNNYYGGLLTEDWLNRGYALPRVELLVIRMYIVSTAA